MKTFMLMTCGVATPSPETMAAWGEWSESVADRIVGHGGIADAGCEISRTGTRGFSPGADSITGYCILRAADVEEAEAIAGRAPFAATIRVYEIAS